ncbi:MAG: DUF2333 family protein [Deltaproteobacteria bacterium]|nr:DUF2333 family protein [Deltaproteobacteria bacterium]
MENRQKHKGKATGRLVALLILAFLVFVVVVMAVNSRKPQRLTLEGTSGGVKGEAFIRVNEMLVEMMYKNWLPNDIFWPTVLLDNMPNFQIGLLEVVRYNIRVLRDNLSRMRTTDKLDPLAEGAFTALSNDPYKWWFPSAESKWKLARARLSDFRRNLEAGRSFFYPRADNLAELLTQYASLMGGVNTRLINAPGDLEITVSEDSQVSGQAGSEMVRVKIPWYRVDDNFYYAQGVAYGLYESFRAIRVDFMDVLVDKNSLKLLDKILENLARCHFEPLIVFNGDPSSIFANHSLNLSGVFNDARQKVNSLIVALKQG